MFSTFTGNSRRPRNVNLSGGAGNPFANTSWTPAAASNATKTVSNAQADRERRHTERQRQKAAGKIQKTWRGHRSRKATANERRAAFDQLFDVSGGNTVAKLPSAFNLLLAFSTTNPSKEDVARVVRFALDVSSVDLGQIAAPETHSSRWNRLVDVLVGALRTVVATDAEPLVESMAILQFVIRMIQQQPQLLKSSRNRYFSSLSTACSSSLFSAWSEILLQAVVVPLQSSPSTDLDSVYESFAAHFLSGSDMVLFEQNIDIYTTHIDSEMLSRAIIALYGNSRRRNLSREQLVWILAHFIHINGAMTSSRGSEMLSATVTQITALSAEISARFAIQHDDEEPAMPLPGDEYLKTQLTSIIHGESINIILKNFALNLSSDSSESDHGASILAGYILSLLQCFPTQADEVRMRLFLEEIKTPQGSIPVVKFLWQTMEKTRLFLQLTANSSDTMTILRRYLDPAPELVINNEEQEWRVILLFLELYIFILRLSDDDDFFSGIYPNIIETDAPTSRIRACSLSLRNVKDLTIFLKNTAFTIYYRSALLSRRVSESSSPKDDALMSTSPARLTLGSLRTIISTAMKMLYERDSRKGFLPIGHWLMTDQLEHEDFMGAVMAEEERQRREEEADSDDDDEDEDVPMAGYSHPVANLTTFSAQRTTRNARLELLRSQQQRAQRERRLAEMGPKLEILKHMPFVVPFDTRVKIFRQFIQLDFERRQALINPFQASSMSRNHQGRIRRGHLFEDAYQDFYKIGDSLKDNIQITFVDQFGQPEAGIDGGGVTKEFLMGVTSEAFGEQDGILDMFASSSNGLLYPNPVTVDARREAMRAKGWKETDPEWKNAITEQLKRYEFLGRVVGKCLYEGILVDLAFAGFFLLKWPSAGPNNENGYKGSVNDLVDMDKELYNGMMRLKNYPGDVADLYLDFTVTDQVSLPNQPVKTISRKLVANGDQVSVTNDNRLLYISYIARHRLVVQPAAQTLAFLRGLREIIRPSWLSMFNQLELQRLVGGDSSEIDIEDLRKHTMYSGLYEVGDDGIDHPTITLFWEVVEEFSDAERRDLLKYVSSTPRAPLLGFSQLRPRFCIRDAGREQDRLPSTSTCVNLLKLPIYTTKRSLKEKLLYAIQSGAGFDLS